MREAHIAHADIGEFFYDSVLANGLFIFPETLAGPNRIGIFHADKHGIFSGLSNTPDICGSFGQLKMACVRCDQGANRINAGLGDIIGGGISAGGQVSLRRVDNPKTAIELPCRQFGQVYLQVCRARGVNLFHIGQRDINMRIQRQRAVMERRDIYVRNIYALRAGPQEAKRNQRGGKFKQ